MRLPSFDLPIALGILIATGAVCGDRLGSFVVVGELALDGQIQPVRGALAVGLACRRRAIGTLLVPRDNSAPRKVKDRFGAGSLGREVALKLELTARPASAFVVPVKSMAGTAACRASA